MKNKIVFALTVMHATYAYSLCTLSGEQRAMSKITLTCEGPQSSEGATDNPFMDYRMEIVFKRGTQSMRVPGFYAADGNAANSSANSGNKWRAYFRAPLSGIWTYQLSFKKGKEIAISNSEGTSAGFFDGEVGSLKLAEPVPGSLLARGRLEYVSEPYLRYSLTGESFIKAGTDEPENFLAYADFDNTKSKLLHKYPKHAKDWKSGDPVWKKTKGKAIVGAVNYLASRGVNSIYFLTYSIDGGDGNDVSMWVKGSDKSRFDVSKLDQWDIVFDHMSQKGVMLHVVMSERENDAKMDKGTLGRTRKLYFKELVARLGNHPMVTWNIGEEFQLGPDRAKEFANYIRGLDAYNNFTVVHTGPKSKDKYYPFLLGSRDFDGASMQVVNSEGNYSVIRKWVTQSISAGRPWVVTHDESGPVGKYGQPDSKDPNHTYERKEFMWGTLMARGGGYEWILFGPSGNKNLQIEDFRTRQKLWDTSRIAADFFRTYIPVTQMNYDNEITTDTKDWVLSNPSQLYVIYRKNGGSTGLRLPAGRYSLDWFDPRKGGFLKKGSVKEIDGGVNTSTGNPPFDSKNDWAILLRRIP